MQASGEVGHRLIRAFPLAEKVHSGTTVGPNLPRAYPYDMVASHSPRLGAP
jgi:hypothetical protein